MGTGSTGNLSDAGSGSLPQGSYPGPPDTAMGRTPTGSYPGGMPSTGASSMSSQPGSAAPARWETEDDIEVLRSELRERDQERERMLKSMKAQKRQLEDQLNGAKRAAEATVRDLSATKQELEDAKQTLASSEQRLRLGASAQEQAARAAADASREQAEQIQQQAHEAVKSARAEKEEALLAVRREMEEQHAAKVKKYQAMIEEVKAERDERYQELQQELQSEVAIRGSKERQMQEAKAELARLQEETRRGELNSRDVQDHTLKMKTEISDLRQKSNSHAMEKLELQRTELVQMKQALDQSVDHVGLLKGDLAPLAKRVALMSEEVTAAKSSLQVTISQPHAQSEGPALPSRKEREASGRAGVSTRPAGYPTRGEASSSTDSLTHSHPVFPQSNAEALVQGVKMEIGELERKLGDEVEAANKKLQQEVKLLRAQLDEAPKSASACVIA
jgi:chromosome segregation ATPase